MFFKCMETSEKERKKDREDDGVVGVFLSVDDALATSYSKFPNKITESLMVYVKTTLLFPNFLQSIPGKSDTKQTNRGPVEGHRLEKSTLATSPIGK